MDGLARCLSAAKADRTERFGPAGIIPGVKSDSVATAVVHGALSGFFTYATYDLSNYATLRNWTLQVTAIDIAWGTLLGGMAAATGCFAANRFAGELS